LFVSNTIALELRDPKIVARLGNPTAGTTLVTVPETAMYKDYLLSTPESQVRRPGQGPDMQSITVSHGVNEPANEHFSLGILGPDKAHPLAALFRRERVAVILDLSGAHTLTLFHDPRAFSFSLFRG
jgi:hypothetical protein